MNIDLRDWFAGIALQGKLANPNTHYSIPEEDAAFAYARADAMMKIHKQNEEKNGSAPPD